jgi:hypothetical protein
VHTKKEKWRRWHGVIGRELNRLGLWREEWEALSRDSAAPASRRAFVGEVYAHALAMGVRRQLKAGSRDISVARLLADIAANIDSLRSGSGDPGPTPARVRHDLADLRRTVRPAENFADRVVAHADRRAERGPPITVLHQALDQLDRLHATYGAWLAG